MTNKILGDGGVIFNFAMQPNCYKLEHVNIEGERWADQGAREVAHFD